MQGFPVPACLCLGCFNDEDKSMTIYKSSNYATICEMYALQKNMVLEMNRQPSTNMFGNLFAPVFY